MVSAQQRRIVAIKESVVVAIRKNRKWSSCGGIPAILVMQAAENWFSDHL
jgi:hypothetical protein